MDNTSKKIVHGIIILIACIALAYGAYRLYLIAVADATQKIKAGVTEGVEEGAAKAMNPFGIISTMFGQK